MILMWLGSFVLVLFSYLATQKYLNQRTEVLQSRLMVGKDKENVVSLVLRNLSIVITDVSPIKTVFTALAKLNLQVGKDRESLMQLCMAPIGFWWPLVLASLYLSLNGGFLLGAAIFALLPIVVPKRIRQTFFFVGCIGLFLVAGEMTLRNSSLLQTILGTSDFAFFLADGRFQAVLALLGVGFVISLVTRVGLWSLFLAMALLVSNNISMNGALGLVVGELLGTVAFVFIQGFKVDKKTRTYISQFSMASVIGIVVGFFVVLQIRTFFVFTNFGDRNAYQDKLMILIILVAVVLAIQTAVQMAWGHFAIKLNKTEATMETVIQYFPAAWIDWELLSNSQKEFVLNGLSKRVSEIKYHSQGIKTLEEGKIPGVVLTRLKTEETELSRILNDWRG